VSAARRASSAQRLAAMPRLEKASATLAAVARSLLDVLNAAEDGRLDVAAAWEAVERVASRERVRAAVAVVEDLVPDDDADEAAMRQTLAGKYGVVRPFLELLAQALPLDVTPAGADLLREVRRLPELARRRAKQKPLHPDEITEVAVSAAWRRAVYHNRSLPEGAVDRDAYVLCVLEQLHRALRRRDIFAVPSHRWADPRAHLLDGAEWLAVRDEVTAGLGLTDPVDRHLADLTATLDVAWRLLADRLEEAGPDASVRPQPAGADGRAKLSVRGWKLSANRRR